jgi:hypothetical protein
MPLPNLIQALTGIVLCLYGHQTVYFFINFFGLRLACKSTAHGKEEEGE